MPPAIIAAGIGLAGSVGGALIGGSAAKKAAKTQAAAADAGIAEQQRQFDLTRSDLAPWLSAGKQGLGGELDILGLNGTDAQQAAIQGLGKGNPVYDSLFRNGQEAILQSASATGGLRGGNVEHSLANFGSDLLGQMIQQQYERLGGISGAGQQTGIQLGQIGQNSAGAIAQLLQAQGAARASGTIGSASALTSGLGAITNFAQTPGLFGGGGGFNPSVIQGLQPYSASLIANNPGVF